MLPHIYLTSHFRLIFTKVTFVASIYIAIVSTTVLLPLWFSSALYSVRDFPNVYASMSHSLLFRSVSLLPFSNSLAISSVKAHYCSDKSPIVDVCVYRKGQSKSHFYAVKAVI